MTFKEINVKTVLHQNDEVRRKINGKYEYYIVVGFDESTDKYILESKNKLPESLGFFPTATVQELINNFEIKLPSVNSSQQ